MAPRGSWRQKPGGRAVPEAIAIQHDESSTRGSRTSLQRRTLTFQRLRLVTRTRTRCQSELGQSGFASCRTLNPRGAASTKPRRLRQRLASSPSFWVTLVGASRWPRLSHSLSSRRTVTCVGPRMFEPRGDRFASRREKFTNAHSRAVGASARGRDARLFAVARKAERRSPTKTKRVKYGSTCTGTRLPRRTARARTSDSSRRNGRTLAPRGTQSKKSATTRVRRFQATWIRNSSPKLCGALATRRFALDRGREASYAARP